MARPTAAQRARARLATARLATSADDLRYLLDVLGLWPHSDMHYHPRIPPPRLEPYTALSRT